MSLSASAPWLRFYGDTPATLSYPDKTMYQLVAQTAEKYPNHTAYIFQGKKTSYAQFMHRIDAAARGLYASGIRKGDRVTICMPNCPQTLDCLYALNRLGAVVNMIHPLSAAAEIDFYLNASGSKAILTLDQFYEKVASVASQNVTILVAKISDELPFPLNVIYPLTKSGRHKLPKIGYTLWANLVRRTATLPADEGKADDPAVILYSGGTTGTPKGVLLSNRSFNAQALQTIAASGFGSIVGMKMLGILPNFHGFGLGVGIHTPLVGGGTCLLVPQFSIGIYADILRKQKPELIPGVPTLFEALLRSDGLQKTDLGFLKGIFCGGDSLSVSLKKKVDAFLLAHGCREQIREGYGATECIAASCLTPRDQHREGSIGIPFPDTYYKIVIPGTCDEVPGIVLTEGDQTFTLNLEGVQNLKQGVYLYSSEVRGEETSQTLRRHEDGKIWLHTGDLGCMDADGFVYFKQRIKRLIVTSGYNVYPSQCENVLDSHEKVLQSCCIGVPDAYRGQKIRAYIVLMPGIEPSETLKQELRRHAAQFIAKYALPREFIFRTELPKTMVGKVAYRVLEEEVAEEERKK